MNSSNGRLLANKDESLSTIGNSLKSALVLGYVSLRHPESIALRRKGINYEHYRDLNKRWITDLGINTVLDVGANIGDFAKLAREVFSSAAIHSFEPLPDCFEKLNNALPGDDEFFTYECGIGSAETTMDFYRSHHSPSSSFLKMGDFHKEAFPYTSDGQVAEPVKVKVKRLDDVLDAKNLKKNLLIKIDVQGFELEALAGAESTLSKAKLVILEMSFTTLYEGQPLFHDVYEKMYGLGFTFRGSLAQMLHPVTGEIVQTDAIFVSE